MKVAPLAVAERNRLNMSWLIKLRWSSIAGQIGTILAVYFVLGVKVPVVPLSVLIGCELLSNVVCAVWSSRTEDVEEWHLAALMALDVVLLTGLLFFTGGPFNPFAFLYLVNIALAAVVVHAQWTWMLVGCALLSLGLLPLLNYHELPLEQFDLETRAELLQKGVWVAFGVASVFIVHFLLRVIGALEAREGELMAAQKQADKQERLASLATMAAGAAHELSTPLATIAVVAKELSRRLDGADERTAEDVRLVREEVGRCRHILNQMAGGMGHGDETHLEAVSLATLVKSALCSIRVAPKVSVELAEEAAEALLLIPAQATEQALRSIITNAQDASPATSPVRVSASKVNDHLRVTVTDHGAGMRESTIERLGEPFYTTKEPGHGMGLGFFLARTVFQRLGGELGVDSKFGVGTRVEILLPIASDKEVLHDKHAGKRDAA